MASNSIEWSRAKELLLNLAQALASVPGEELAIPKGLRAAFAFQPRLFAPPLKNEAPFRHPVRLLTALQTARQEIDELLESLPKNQEPATAIAKSSEKTEVQKQPAQNQPAEKQQVVDKQSTEKPIFEKPASFSQRTPTRPTTPALSEKKPETPTVFSQGQKLIDQVRDAIRTLSSSVVIANPRQAPLKDVFERLKPLVEEMITAVAEGGMPSFDENSKPPFRLPLPISPREHLLKKSIPFPKAEPKPEKSEAPRMRERSPQRIEEKSSPFKEFSPLVKDRPVKKERIEADPKLEKREVISPRSERQEVTPEPKTETKPEQTKPDVLENREPKQSFKQVPTPQQQPQISAAPTLKPKQEGETPTPTAEKTVLPAAPFVSGVQSLFSSRKRKKRKGLWDKEEEEEKER